MPVYISAMSAFFFTLMAIGMIGTVVVLVLGLFAMARGGAFNDKWANRLMRYRVLFQGLALLFFAIGMLGLKG